MASDVSGLRPPRCLNSLKSNICRTRCLPSLELWINGLSEMKLYKSLTQSLNFAADDSAISNHLEQAALEEEVERLALDDESSDDGLGGSNEDDSE